MTTMLVVALDFPDKCRALSLASSLEKFDLGFKVGMELFYAEGPSIVREIKKMGKPVVLDLKLHDIPNTVKSATKAIKKLNVDYFTFHLASGSQAAHEVMTELRDSSSKVLGVTVLTSFDDSLWTSYLEKATATQLSEVVSVSQSVTSLARQAAHWGLHGVVCSAHELESVRKSSPSLVTLVPGIRTSGDSHDDQKRAKSPKEAADLGATMIVVGRAITQAADPVRTTAAILSEIRDS